MPTATQFTALGSGNGFPFCLSKVNVSVYDHWTTLGGVNKDNPASSDELIRRSLEAAMKLFWNLDAINCDAKYLNSASVSSAVMGVTDGLGSAIEPKDRVCKSDIRSSTTDPNGSYINEARVGSILNIRRLYDGITSDEDNFIGYGASGGTSLTSIFAFMQCSGGAFGGRSYISLSGYCDEWNNSGYAEDYQYVNLGDTNSPIWLVCSAAARADAGYSGTAHASSLISTVATASGSGKAEITDFVFYTY